jgi:hypothetical protein
MTTLENHTKAAREHVAKLEKELAQARADLLLAIKKFYGLVPGVTRVRVTEVTQPSVKVGTEFIYFGITQQWSTRPWINGVRPGGKQIRNLYSSWEVVDDQQ